MGGGGLAHNIESLGILYRVFSKCVGTLRRGVDLKKCMLFWLDFILRKLRMGKMVFCATFREYLKVYVKGTVAQDYLKTEF